MTDHLTLHTILRTADFDRYDRLLPSAVLDLFQDAASQHAAQLGLGFEDMARRGQLWVVLRVYYEQLAQPALFETVEVTTWPNPPGLLDFSRHYRTLGADGRELIRGCSQWAVLDAATRRILPGSEVGFPADATRTERLFPERLRKLPDFSAEGEITEQRVHFSDLDRNGHVNNAKYARFILDHLPPAAERQIRSFQLDYHRETMPGTVVQLSSRRTEEELLYKGCDSDGTLLFSCRCCLSHRQCIEPEGY